MIVIEIESTQVKEKSGMKGDKPWSMVFQPCSFVGHYVDGFASRHPRESTIQLDRDNPQPFPVGKYVIDAESFFFGDFGRFTMGRMKLQPLNQFMAEIKKQFEVKAAA